MFHQHHLIAFGDVFSTLPSNPTLRDAAFPSGAASHAKCSQVPAVRLLCQSAQQLIFLEASEGGGKKPFDLRELSERGEATLPLSRCPPLPTMEEGHTQQKTPRSPREKLGGASNARTLCSLSHCAPTAGRGVRQALWSLPAWKGHHSTKLALAPASQPCLYLAVWVSAKPLISLSPNFLSFCSEAGTLP